MLASSTTSESVKIMFARSTLKALFMLYMSFSTVRSFAWGLYSHRLFMPRSSVYPEHEQTRCPL